MSKEDCASSTYAAEKVVQMKLSVENGARDMEINKNALLMDVQVDIDNHNN